MKACIICLVVLASCLLAAEGRKRPYESANRWGSSVTSAVRLSCLNNSYTDELACRCAWNAGLVPASIGGIRPGCSEEFACNRLGGNNCNACDESRENELTCRGLVSARDLRRAYTVIVIILFTLLLTVSVANRAVSTYLSLREVAMLNTIQLINQAEEDVDEAGPGFIPAMEQPKAKTVDEESVREIGNWQWTFWPLFMLPCIAILGALSALISVGKEGGFWYNWVQMPRWDHYTDSVQMPDGDWEEDFAFPAVSNLPEMFVEYSSQDRWIFDENKSDYFYLTSEFFFLFIALAAVFVFPAAHTLAAYCRVAFKTQSLWPECFYGCAIGLLFGIIGIANIQSAYGKSQTDAHFGLSIIFFVFSFLMEILVFTTVATMNRHWFARFRRTPFPAAIACIFRTVYVLMYFISPAYADNHNSHLIAYSTQNFFTWIFTWSQLWMIQTLPIAHIDKPQVQEGEQTVPVSVEDASIRRKPPAAAALSEAERAVGIEAHSSPPSLPPKPSQAPPHMTTAQLGFMSIEMETPPAPAYYPIYAVGPPVIGPSVAYFQGSW